jgi:hypothetical protein
MNNPDHISESVETIFWVEILYLFDADPGSGVEKIWIWDKHPGPATLIFVVLKFLRSLIFKHKKATHPQLRDLATNANFFTPRDMSYLQYWYSKRTKGVPSLGRQMKTSSN